MSSDIRRIRRWARLSAVPPPEHEAQMQSFGFDSGDRCERLDDVEIFFD